MNEHQDQEELYTQARAMLMAHPVPCFADGVTPEAAVRELARLSVEGADLIARTRETEPDAHDAAATYRRTAAVLAHLADAHPQFAGEARRAIAVWQTTEQRATEAAVRAAAAR